MLFCGITQPDMITYLVYNLYNTFKNGDHKKHKFLCWGKEAKTRRQPQYFITGPALRQASIGANQAKCIADVCE